MISNFYFHSMNYFFSMLFDCILKLINYQYPFSFCLITFYLKMTIIYFKFILRYVPSQKNYNFTHFYIFPLLHLFSFNCIVNLTALNFDPLLQTHQLSSFQRIKVWQMDLIIMVFEFWINLQATTFLIAQNFLIFL